MKNLIYLTLMFLLIPLAYAQETNFCRDPEYRKEWEAAQLVVHPQ